MFNGELTHDALGQIEKQNMARESLEHQIETVLEHRKKTKKK